MPRSPFSQLGASLRGLWVPPEAHFAEARDRAELTLSWIRLGVVACFLGITGFATALEPVPLNTVNLALVLLALSVSALFHLALRKGWARSQLPFVAVVLELGLVSLVLAIHMAAETPVAGTNDRVAFPLVLMIVSATAARFDPRVSLFAGGLATLLYGGIAISAGLALTGAGVVPPSTHYGNFDALVQVSRIFLILSATGITTWCAQQTREIVAASGRDELTGLFNRRVLDVSVRQCVQVGRPFTLALLDVDHFKQLNDAHGHVVGDAALRHLASRLKREFRTVDLVARYGGEEFAVLLMDGDPDGCVERLEALRARIAEGPVLVRLPGRPLRTLPALSVSIGVSVWPEDGPGPHDLMEAADRRMYAAKLLGRNRVVGPDPVEAVHPGEASAEGQPVLG